MENVAPTASENVAAPMDVEPTKPPAPPAETAAAPESAEAPKAPEPAKEPEAPKEPEEPAKEAEPVVEAAKEPAAKEEPAAEAEDDDDDEDEAPKPGLYNGSQIVEGKRARKSTERIVIEEPQKKKQVVGTGTPLGEMPEVDELMREAKNKDALEDLHRVVFKTKGAKGKVRKNLATFAGFVFEDEAKEKPRLLDRLAKFKNGQITAMLDLCRVDRSAKSFEGKVDKDKLINRLVEFLEKPSPSMQKALPKRKRAPAKKKAVTKKADSEDEDDEDEEEVMPVSYVLPRPFPIAAIACWWGLHATTSSLAGSARARRPRRRRRRPRRSGAPRSAPRPRPRRSTRPSARTRPPRRTASRTSARASPCRCPSRCASSPPSRARSSSRIRRSTARRSWPRSRRRPAAR